LEANLEANHNFFQTKQITNLIYQHLQGDSVKEQIMKKNPFSERYGKNNDIHIHIRLTDAKRNNPGISYYSKAISGISYDRIFISTDEKTHPIIRQIIDTHPNAFLVDYDPVATIQFASTCKYNILSHGSFSAMIGYLAFFSTVYYPQYEEGKVWYGDMFSIDGWVKNPL
jgi:hypothetical protein